MRIQTIQEGFTAGSVTPLIHGRMSSDIYNESVALMNNMISTSHGPAIRRPGTRNIVQLKRQVTEDNNILLENGTDTLYLEDGSGSYLTEAAGVVKNPIIPFAAGTPYFHTTLHISPSFATMYDKNGVINISAADIEFSNPWASKDLDLLAWVQLPGINPRLIIVHPDVAPYELKWTGTTFTLTLITFTVPPWTTPIWPEAVGYYEGRLIFGSSKTQPERSWLSKVNDHYNFTAGSGAADSFSFDLDKPGKIKWIEGLDTLLLGTGSGIWDITPFSNTSLLGPGNYKAKRRNSFAAYSFYHYVDDTGVIYIAQEGKRVYSIRPGTQLDKDYKSDEPSFTGRHLLENKINNISGVQYPHSIVFMPRNGGVIGMTHSPEKLPYSGWHHHTTLGTIYDMYSIFDNGEYLTFVTINYEGIVYLLRLDWDYPLDSNKLVTPSPASAILTGLSHLEGESVYVWANNKSYGPHTVVSGQITISEATSTAVVGLGFSSKIITRRLSKSSPFGPDQGLIKRWNKIGVRVGIGQRPKLNGSRPANAEPNDPSVDYNSTEDVMVSNMGFSKFGHVTIEEDTAAPLMVAALFGQVSSETV